MNFGHGRGLPHRLFTLGLAGLCVGLSTSRAYGDEPPSVRRSMVLATTTSVRDSGLLDALLPAFREAHRIEVRVIAVGTGAALRMGREGNADCLLTHAPSAEQVLLEDGIARRRIPFMQNHFVLAGPPEDPAGLRGIADPVEAMAALARIRAPWVSRDDDSGTHKRERALWRAAGIETEPGWPGFVRTGAGMGHSLQVAGEKRAYILSDIGTFLAFRNRIGLEALSKPSAPLRNVYSVLLLDPDRFEHALADREAEAFAAFLLEPATQARIADFGRDRFGQPLFGPLAPLGGRPGAPPVPASVEAPPAQPTPSP